MGEKQMLWRWILPAAILLGGGSAWLIEAAGFSGRSLTAPLTGLGSQLREWSLSSGGGNLLAWAVVLCLSALPALGLLWRGRKKADLLLLLTGGEIFVGLYFLVNPSLLGAELPAEDLWALTAVGTVAATLVAWAVLRLLDRVEGAQRLGAVLGRLLAAAAVLLTFFGTAALTSELLQETRSIAQANVNSHIGETATYHILRFLWVLDVALNAMTASLLLRGSQLARILDDAPFSQEAVNTAGSVSRHCRYVTGAALLVCVLGNLTQMLLFSRTRSIHVSVNFPVSTVLLSVCLHLLCRYFRRAKAVSDDNASII